MISSLDYKAHFGGPFFGWRSENVAGWPNTDLEMLEIDPATKNARGSGPLATSVQQELFHVMLRQLGFRCHQRARYQLQLLDMRLF